MARIERATSPLPRECSATELHGRKLLAAMLPSGSDVTGAGEGNRTLVVSLEGFCSTIELHPPGISEKPLPHQFRESAHTPTQLQLSRLPMPTAPGHKKHKHDPKITWWRGKDSNLRRLSQQIYSLPPLTAREPLRTKPAIIIRFIDLVNETGHEKCWAPRTRHNGSPVTAANLPNSRTAAHQAAKNDPAAVQVKHIRCHQARSTPSF